jgi:cysteine-rich repeat protein
MCKELYRLAALSLAFTLFGCDSESYQGPVGSVQFYLQTPNGEIVESVKLQLLCPGSAVDVSHVLDVKKGEVVAVFGGLAPGPCTVNMRAETRNSVDCIGTESFAITPNAVAAVQVNLICQGLNDGAVGGVKITTDFTVRECEDDRIKDIYAIPANVLVGETTLIGAEIYPEAAVGTPKFKWTLRNEVDDTGEAGLTDAPGECKDGAASCNRLTCLGLGTNPQTDERTGLPIGGVFVSVQYEDDECFDTEEVWVYCVQASVCGDRVVGGRETCDDGNTIGNDGCSMTCLLERCGDGIVQPGEECDGQASVPMGKACNSSCVIDNATCGDNVVNQTTEVCDGAAGVMANQQCGSDCLILPLCGNNIVELPEECDDVDDPMCVACKGQGSSMPRCGDGLVNQTSETCDGTSGLMTGQVCSAACQITPTCGNAIVEAPETCDVTTAQCVNCMQQTPQANACETCIAMIPEVGTYNQEVCKTNPLCDAARKCILDNPTCWTAIAPAACYCGDTQAAIDACEIPSTVPSGRCATEMRAAGGANASNAEVLGRYFDLVYAVGAATTIVDSAFNACRDECF